MSLFFPHLSANFNHFEVSVSREGELVVLLPEDSMLIDALQKSQGVFKRCVGQPAGGKIKRGQ